MKTSSPTPRKTLSEWKALAKRQAESGLTQREFCEREGISLSGFSRRLKLLRKSASFVELPIEHLSPEEPTAPDSAERWALDVTLPDGTQLRFRG